MEESVLLSTKKILGISPGDESFDLDIITHINSAFSTLGQVGLVIGSYVEDDSLTWADAFVENPDQIALIKTCVYLQVRLLFDPPATSYLLSAAQEQIQEHIWRLNINREETDWVDPDPPGVVLDG
jgi:hypothetical protein